MKVGTSAIRGSWMSVPLAIVLLAAGCNAPPSTGSTPSGGSPSSSPSIVSSFGAPAGSPAAGAGKAIRVLYAGSLVNLMEKGIGPAFQKEAGVPYQGQGAGSVALANAIKDRTKTGDVFVSADTAVNHTLMGQANGDWVSWYVLFARTTMVVGYNPKSRFAPDFEKVKNGSMPWYRVLQEPGFKLGRTDPSLDPKGYRTLFLFDLAQAYYRVPDLKQKVLGSDTNSQQIFPEETLEARLESGALDAGIFYLNEAVEKNLPYITLPDEVNQGNPELAGVYATATYTNARGQTFKGAPILYTAAGLSRAARPDAALAFVQYILSPQGQAIMQSHGLLGSPVLAGGNRSAIPAALQPLVQGEYKG